jgi:hypothetical protein
MKRALIALALVAIAGAASWSATRAATRPPFSGWLKAQLVHDSVWGNCKVSVFVDERARGSIESECRTPEGLRTAHVENALAPQEVEELRRLLRDADLFQGQFWGHDLRGIDATLGTLTVNDEAKMAAVVCIKNESFDAGPRERLLSWLTKRLAKPGGSVHK